MKVFFQILFLVQQNTKGAQAFLKLKRDLMQEYSQHQTANIFHFLLRQENILLLL